MESLEFIIAYPPTVEDDKSLVKYSY